MSLKDLPQNPPLGERLKARRVELGLSQKDVAQEIQAPLKYIEAFEIGNYSVFSAKIYALGYFRKLIALYALEHPEALLNEFAGEWEVGKRVEGSPARVPENRGPTPLITPAKLGITAAILFFAAFLSFFGWRFSEFVRAPDVIISEPREEAVYGGPTIKLQGTVQQESRLTVNSREITIDKSGGFDENFELAVGLNTLEFIVEDRFGKITKVIRHVILK